MDILSYMTAHGHEQLNIVTDRASGLRAIIGVHDTTLGPALGGCRFYPYESDTDAILDVLRLSEGMSYKSAMAGLALGGGKCVVIGDPATDKSPALFHALGRAVQQMGGRYITAEDVGTTVSDLGIVSEVTDYVVGLSEEKGGGGDPSPWTALGVLRGMMACAHHLWGSDDLAGRHVAIQGVGKVGYALAEMLHERGARLTVCDTNEALLARATQALGAEVVGLDEIYAVDCDIFSPCALGATINDETIPQLRCAIVSGSANNQLAEPRHGEMLRQRGILYAPDYVINAGGVINVACELGPDGYDESLARTHVMAIYDNVLDVLKRADAEGVSTSVAADSEARHRIARARQTLETAG